MKDNEHSILYYIAVIYLSVNFIYIVSFINLTVSLLFGLPVSTFVPVVVATSFLVETYMYRLLSKHKCDIDDELDKFDRR